MLKRTVIFVLIFLLGAILISVASSTIPHASIWHEVIRDLGIAFAVAATIGGIIEWTLARDLELRGINAAVAEFIDPAVWKEICDHIITQPVMRQNFCVSVNSV